MNRKEDDNSFEECMSWMSSEFNMKENILYDDYDFVKVESLEDLFECCHTCGNCISDEEEHLTCIYDNESKDFDDVCDKWELDKDMI